MHDNRLPFVLVIAAAVACGDPSGPPTGPVSLTVVSGSTIQDSIDAGPSTPVVVRATRGGRPASGVTVTFEAPAVDSVTGVRGFALARTPRAQTGLVTVPVVTDNAGEARVFVLLSARPNRYTLRVRAENSSDTLSTSVVIGPGNAVRFGPNTPRDTAVLVGSTYPLQVGLADRLGNFTVSGRRLTSRRPTIVSYDTTTGLLRALAIGRVWVVADESGVRDSVAISVIPSGRVVVSAEEDTLFLINTDGSNRRAVVSNLASRVLIDQFSIAPNGASIYYAARPDFGVNGVWVSDTLDRQQMLFQPAAPEFGNAAQVQPSRDGQWLYYIQALPQDKSEIWRARIDGSNRERVGPVGDGFSNYTSPSPSPDGTRLAFGYQSGEPTRRLSILNIATGQFTVVAQDTIAQPRWSPVADEIAYFGFDGSISVARSDGTKVLGPVRLIENPFHRFDSNLLNWSGDGRYLAACVRVGGGRYLAIIVRETGEVLPLQYSRAKSYCWAGWRP
jgi:hypothetical protein